MEKQKETKKEEYLVRCIEECIQSYVNSLLAAGAAPAAVGISVLTIALQFVAHCVKPDRYKSIVSTLSEKILKEHEEQADE